MAAAASHAVASTKVPSRIVWNSKLDINDTCLVGYYGPHDDYHERLLRLLSDSKVMSSGISERMAGCPSTFGYCSIDAIAAHQKTILETKWTHTDICARIKKAAHGHVLLSEYEKGTFRLVGTFDGHLFTLYDRERGLVHVGGASTFIPELHLNGKQTQIDKWVTDLLVELTAVLVAA